MTPTSIRYAISTSLVLMFVSVLAYAPGCRAPEETWTTRDTTLDIDPIDRLDLTGWWSNGQELLRLERDGRYLLYGSPTRLEPPLHRGRWDQRTHNRLTLEPYSELDMEPLSTAIMTVDGEHVLRLPGYPDFYRTTPPDREPMQMQPPPIEPMSNRA